MMRTRSQQDTVSLIEKEMTVAGGDVTQSYFNAETRAILVLGCLEAFCMRGGPPAYSQPHSRGLYPRCAILAFD